MCRRQVITIIKSRSIQWFTAYSKWIACCVHHSKPDVGWIQEIVVSDSQFTWRCTRRSIPLCTIQQWLWCSSCIGTTLVTWTCLQAVEGHSGVISLTIVAHVDMGWRWHQQPSESDADCIGQVLTSSSHHPFPILAKLLLPLPTCKWNVHSVDWTSTQMGNIIFLHTSFCLSSPCTHSGPH